MKENKGVSRKDLTPGVRAAGGAKVKGPKAAKWQPPRTSVFKCPTCPHRLCSKCKKMTNRYRLDVIRRRNWAESNLADYALPDCCGPDCKNDPYNISEDRFAELYRNGIRCCQCGRASTRSSWEGQPRGRTLDSIPSTEPNHYACKKHFTALSPKEMRNKQVESAVEVANGTSTVADEATELGKWYQGEDGKYYNADETLARLSK